MGRSRRQAGSTSLQAHKSKPVRSRHVPAKTGGGLFLDLCPAVSCGGDLARHRIGLSSHGMAKKSPLSAQGTSM